MAKLVNTILFIGGAFFVALAMLPPYHSLREHLIDVGIGLACWWAAMRGK